ncbi:acetate kinase [Stackebrandtia endophytica]|uniref:Acetate kinase n=1 Tax=Stackebrandtia endophytica TaxID=1496996 RepID=A0A543AS95_9ACTN|nr:acetate kinase [Stackebrandtia endophytica]TQL75453.1 acetate kinase [Stackebrandtia endophytica]
MNSHVLVLNSGSSSIKYQLLNLADGSVVAAGLAERIGESGGHFRHTWNDHRIALDVDLPDHDTAMRRILAAFDEEGPDLTGISLAAIGHRVVHGGDEFSAPTLITDKVCDTIDRLSALAPLHNPANLAGIRTARSLFTDIPHVAVFDTAFHATMPEAAYTYAVPDSWRTEHGVRRYGFHGTSHSYVAGKAAGELRAEPGDVNLITLHLGNGASACAVRAGRSVDTSMGLTPLEGLVMGTRSGDLDPAILMHMHRSAGLSSAELDDALNHDSGLRGLAGENDMRRLRERAEAGDRRAALAREVYCHRIRKYLGAYLVELGHVDGIVFTGGVGENDAGIRRMSLAGLRDLGIVVDDERNARGDTWISTRGSGIAVLVIPTNEELEIARQALSVAQTASTFHDGI